MKYSEMPLHMCEKRRALEKIRAMRKLQYQAWQLGVTPKLLKAVLAMQKAA